jgi:hypothetical protein
MPSSSTQQKGLIAQQKIDSCQTKTTLLGDRCYDFKNIFEDWQMAKNGVLTQSRAKFSKNCIITLVF